MAVSHVSAGWSPELCAEILDRHQGREGALLPILHDIQHAFGFVPDEAVPQIAETLNLSRAEVHGVVTFYHDFRKAPAGRRVIKLCQAEACQARGAREITAAAEKLLNVRLGETTADGEVTLEPIYCLGLCASGPSALVDDKPVARLETAHLSEQLEGATV